MAKGYSRASKRAYVEFEEEELGGGGTTGNGMSVPLAPQQESSDDSPLGVSIEGKWGKYLVETGLIDSSELNRTPKPFPLKGQRLREYRKSMEKLVTNFRTEVISDFDINAVCRDSGKRQPAESRQSTYEQTNEPTLRVIDSANTIIRDGTTKRSVNLESTVSAIP